MPSSLLVLLALLSLASSSPGVKKAASPRDQIAANQHVETYWESWSEKETDFVSQISEIPVTPMGSHSGVNVVNIAFADNSITDR